MQCIFAVFLLGVCRVFVLGRAVMAKERVTVGAGRRTTRLASAGATRRRNMVGGGMVERSGGEGGVRESMYSECCRSSGEVAKQER